MRASRAICLGIGLACVIAACSRPNSGADGAPPPPPAVPPTVEQKAVLATLPAPYRNADIYDGQAKFAACRSCHTVARGADAAYGPNLWGVFGRRSGSAPGYAYSKGLTRLGVIWTPQTLDAWIANPRAIVPETKMAFAGIEDPGDRIDVVAYLKTVTTLPPNTRNAAGR